MRIKNKKIAKVIEIDCVVCKRVFFRRKINSKTHTKSENIRPYNCKTCSKECSKIKEKERLGFV